MGFLVAFFALFLLNAYATESLDKKIHTYAHTNPYISQCLNQVPERTRVSIDRYWYEDCRSSKNEENIYIEKKKYQLEIKNGAIELSTSICFSYRGDEARRVVSTNALERTLPCFRNFFARHGIKLNLSFSFESGTQSSPQCDHSTNLHYHYHSQEELLANSQNWVTHHSTNSIRNKDYNPNSRCVLAIHEFGHLLGLVDTSKSSKCINRKRTMPIDDIMNAHFLEGPYYKKFYPYAIEELLAPLCSL